MLPVFPASASRSNRPQFGQTRNTDYTSPYFCRRYITGRTAKQVCHRVTDRSQYLLQQYGAQEGERSQAPVGLLPVLEIGTLLFHIEARWGPCRTCASIMDRSRFRAKNVAPACQSETITPVHI